MTKLNGKSIKREMTAGRYQLIIELDERTQMVRMWEKGSRTHYQLPAMSIFTMMIWDGTISK